MTNEWLNKKQDAHPKSPKEEMPLKFKKGGKVRGAGIERKGLRKAKMR